MKRFKLFSILACAVMMLSICSCSKKETPADQFVKASNALTEKFEKAETMEEVMAFAAELDSANQIIYDNRDYVLTDKDKDAIIEAMIKMTLASSKHLNYTPSEAELEMFKTALSEQIKKADTLGDLIPAGAQAPEENIEETAVETVEEATAISED